MPGLDWGIVAKIDRDEAFEPMRHIARDTLIQTLVILLVITIVVMFLATSFVRPVNDLIARVQLARTGKTDMTFAAESTDEIGDLARSFRELIDSVQKQTRLLDAGDHARISAARKRDAEGHGRNGCASGRARSPNASKTSRVVFAELQGSRAIHAGDVRQRVGRRR